MILKKLFKYLSPKYGNYSKIIWKNRLNNLLNKKSEHKYLFILSPPYCGSTMLNELLSTASSVSVNNSAGTREGQKLPTVRHIMFDHEYRWDENYGYNWSFIKNEWRKYWDLSSSILLEKSPPNIIRAKSIEQHFTPSFFIVFHRNPYAHCESLMRRDNTDATSAAKFAIKCLTYQKQNLTNLKNVLKISYEELTDETRNTKKLLNQFLPELTDIKHDKLFSAHNFHEKKMKIQNLNDEKISNLRRNQIKDINTIFECHVDLLNFFNYKLIS